MLKDNKRKKLLKEKESEIKNNNTKLKKIEMETTISYNYEENCAEIFTHERKLITKLDKYCTLYPDTYKLINDSDYEKWGCKSYKIPRKMVSIRQPRILSEELKNKISNRMKKLKSNTN